MTRKLTVKEAKLVKAKAQGKTHVEAYKEVYSATAANSTAAQNTTKILQKPNVQEALQREMAKQGITIETIVQPVAEALKADKVHIVGNGDQAMADVVPDHSTRLNAVKIASKWMGADQQPEGGSNITNFIQINQTQKDKYAD